jgi:hypothetical protein
MHDAVSQVLADQIARNLAAARFSRHNLLNAFTAEPAGLLKCVHHPRRDHALSTGPYGEDKR